MTARKLLVVLAAVLVPGGFIALFGAWLVRTLGQTERGRRVVELAKSSVPSWVAGLRTVGAQQRQAA